MKKRLLSLLLTLTLCLSMMPAEVWAEDSVRVQSGESVAEVTINDSTTQYTDIETAFTAAQEADSATVKLLQDVTIPKGDYCYGIDLEKGSIVLDLNGKTIKTTTSTDSSFVPLCAVFYIESGAMLTVQDSVGTGKIEQPNGGQAISVSDGTLTVKSGTIEVTSNEERTSSYVTTQNCAVFVSNYGTANIQGGKLIGKKGIYIKSGTLNINGNPLLQGRESYALLVAASESTVKLSGGTYSSESNAYSIWNSVGTAEKLLDSEYRYEDVDGKESTYSDDGSSVVGTAVVKERPVGEASYIDANGKEATQTGCVSLTADGFETLQVGEEAWYVADTNITCESGFRVTGTVNLILCDNVTVTLKDGLSINGGFGNPATLNIYRQREGTGKLEAMATGMNACICNDSRTDDTVSNLNIYGGIITSTGALYKSMPGSPNLCGAGVGTAAKYSYDNLMNVHIFGGTVTAKAGGSGAEAIGKGTGARGTVTVNIAEGMKCVRTDDPSKSCNWNNTEGTSVTITKCEDHNWVYTSDNAEQHLKKCSLCGIQGENEAHSFDTWTSDNETNHTSKCVCGETKTEAHTLDTTANDDGVNHSQKCNICGYKEASEEHDFAGKDTYTVCTKCSAPLAASYNGVKYASLQRAVDAAKGSGGTVTLEQEVEEHIVVADGEVIIDLNNQAWGRNLSDQTNNYVPLTVTGGTVTLKNGRLHQKGSSSEARDGVAIKGGKLIVAEDVSVRSGYAGDDMIFYSINLQSGSLTLSEGAALLSGLKVPADKKLADYLPEGTTFVKCTYTAEGGVVIPDQYEYVTEAYTGNATTESMAVVAHTHSCTAENSYKCVCGFTCTHKTFEDGKCTTCGYVCTHDTVDENYTCTVCNTQMVVKVEKNDVTTYSTDFTAAMNKAENGTTITLLKDVEQYRKSACITGEGNTVTLNLAGHTINGGWIKVGNDADDNVKTSSILKIIGNGSLRTDGNLTVGEKGVLNLSEWGSNENDYIKAITLNKTGDEEGELIVMDGMQGTIKSLGFYSRRSNGVKTKLKGGRYGTITLTMSDYLMNDEPFHSMLEQGYVFRYIDTGEIEKYTSGFSYSGPMAIYNVEVIKCPHGGDATGTDDNYKCIYCNTAVKVKVSRGGTDQYYATLADALTHTEDGDIVTLLATAADTNGYEIKHAITLDLNGNGIGQVTCSAKGVKIKDSKESGIIGTLTVSDGRLKDLLPEGYGFRNISGTWASESDLNGTTINNISVKQAPIESLSLAVTNEKVVYGYDEKSAPVITAAVTFRSEDTAAENVTYQWYQIKDNSAEPISGATKDTYQLSSGLDAGTYTFYCIATADGYAVASEDVSVTVEEAEPNVTTVPKAVENLSYTGSAQELITKGEASNGVMKYSLEQDGTYTDEIPTGIDAGTYTVWYKIIGDKNYKDSEPASVEVTIAPMKLSGVVSPKVAAVKRVYDKTNKAAVTTITFLKENGEDTIDLTTEDYTISDVHFNDANAGNNKRLIITVSLHKNYVFADEATKTVTEKTFEYAKDSTGAAYEITKAAAPENLVNVEKQQKYTITEGSTLIAGTGMPQDAGILSYAKRSDAAIEKVANWEVDAATGKVTYTLSGGAAKDVITLPVTIRSTNYKDAAVDIVITLTEKDIPTVTVQNLTVTYDGSPVPANKIQGTATFDGKPVAGNWEWKNNTAVTNVADSGEKTVVFKPQETENYAEVEKNIYLTINKATPTGEPKYTLITANDKKLSDAGLTTEGSTFSVGGTVKWVDNDGNELSGETGVVCGEAYRWEFTPADTGNYNKLDGTVILCEKTEEKLTRKQVKKVIKSAKFKTKTTKVGKKSIKVQITVKRNKKLMSDLKFTGYTVKYQFYRSKKKNSGYKLFMTSKKNSFITKKGTKYYYKVRVLIYDGKKLISKSKLKQCN